MRELSHNAISSNSAEPDAADDMNSDVDRHLARLYTPTSGEPWLRSLVRSVRDTINPPKLPPLELTCKPAAVKDIWGLYSKDEKSNLMSLAVHITAVVLLFTMASGKAVQNTTKKFVSLVAPDIAEYIPKAAPQRTQMGGGGGGGDRSPTVASKGRLPRPSSKQFTPPVAAINDSIPKLLMDPAIIAPPDTVLPNVNLANWGDPLSKMGPPANGPGSAAGMGNGSGGGVGSGKGGGYGPGEGGGVGGGLFRVGGSVSAPVVLYKVDPEYSEEARKAKYSGTVVLQLIVGPTGRPQSIHVVRSLGMGLDEKAIEAVNKWNFRPGYHNGQPVAVIAAVEIKFRLL
jgi:periplasmic protein TonB